MAIQSSSYRIEADLLRIFAGFAVVLIHTTDLFLLQPVLIGGSSWLVLDMLNILGKVAVPFFIMLSGFLLLNKDKQLSVKQFYTKRVNRIAIPFVVWVSIYFWWMAFWGKYDVSLPFIVSSIFTVSILHLYFIPIIAELYLITPLLWKYIFSRSVVMQYFITCLFFLMGIILNVLSQIIPRLNTEHSIFTIFIPYIGYFLAGALCRSLKLRKKIIIGAGVISLGAFILTFVLRKHDVNNQIVAYLSPTIVLFSVGSFVILQKVFSLCKQLSQKTISLVRLFSSTIFGIFLVHIIVRDVLGILPIFDPYKVHSPILIFVLLDVLVVFLISFGIVAGIKKIPYLSAIFG